MKVGIPLIIICLLCIAASIPIVSASYPVNTSNTSAQQLIGPYNPYTFVNGDDTFEVFALVPFTTEGLVYPQELWDMLFLVSWGCLLLGIIFASKKDHVPSIAITACGVLAMGGFFICAMMLPLTGTSEINVQVVPKILASGASAGNNTVYMTQYVNYPHSPEIAYLCWGLGVAGFIELILGALSFLGVFQRKGLAQSQRGDYLEQDIDGQEPEAIRWREKRSRREP